MGYVSSPANCWNIPCRGHGFELWPGTRHRAAAIPLPPACSFNIGKSVIGAFLEVDPPRPGYGHQRQISFEQAEELVLGINHAELGAILLERWSIPEPIVNIVRYRLRPDDCPERDLALDLVHVGDVIAKMTGIGMGIDGMHYAPSQAVFERLGITPQHMETLWWSCWNRSPTCATPHRLVPVRSARSGPESQISPMPAGLRAKAGKFMMHTGQLAPRARVGVAFSGGVDSLALLATLVIRRRIVPFPVELMLLHVNPGFDPQNHAPLATLAADWGLPAHIAVTDFGPRAFSEENKKKSVCFYCAWLRRKRLFDLCARYRLTHLAFGHNADDLASTFFMNLFHNGRVDGLSGRESFFGGKLTVIRPLLLVDKKTIIRAAKAWELPVFANPAPCPANPCARGRNLDQNHLRGGKKREVNCKTPWAASN
jgi:tRNA(Ile)-lysidine synthase TilS/MesJ